jgi:hypothetical protein
MATVGDKLIININVQVVKRGIHKTITKMMGLLTSMFMVEISQGIGTSHIL